MAQNSTHNLRFIEAGAAFMDLAGLDGGLPSPRARAHGEAPARRAAEPEHVDVIVIGGGQAGLSVGYHLQQRGLRFVILDASARIGDTWRKRWDSLRLFSPAWLDGLDGMPFPGPRDAFPTKDQMADYLESYAARFALPVRSGTRVERLSRRGGRYVVQTSGGELEADQVVIAMANYQIPSVPAFAGELRPDIVQLHSSQYRNAGQLRPGRVLVVGCGNSGAEIAAELSRTHRVCFAGRDVGQVPHKPDGFWGRLILTRLLMRVVFHRLLTIRTLLGRKARPRMSVMVTPLIRTKRKHLAAAGVQFAPRVAGVRDGMPVAEDGAVLDADNVVWCTGHEKSSSFIDLPVFDADGELQHEGGVVASSPGLFFVGLHFLFSMSSAMVHGVGRDAQRIAGHVAERAVQASSAR
jgi:putative flavoprotein involved in K+ transport